ncbi:PCDH1-like protein [Mya arenaria]|uniref:PCDH1-like protein n=1 Tax=Mya arenaria TaxID=6604 RepID=A0ABY7DRC7_MYAAR|nr:PCDH1-like protein [Mya arenaria]
MSSSQIVVHFLLSISIFLSVLISSSAEDFAVTFSKEEQLPKWTFIGNVSDAPGFMEAIPIEDRDHLLFSFLQQTNIKSMITIHDETGSLYTTVVIDRESIMECRVPAPCTLKFNIAARSSRPNSPLFEIISVTVIFEDINDNAPTFPKEKQTIEISESVVNGSTFVIENAVDDDAGINSIQSYRLEGYTNIFALEVERKLDNSLSVKLVVIGKLNRENRDWYESKVTATDGGNPPKTGSMILDIRILDENDNAPVFMNTSYNVTIQEDARYGASVAQITATDKDIGQNGNLLYRFSPHQSDFQAISSLFHINEHTGMLTVIGTLVYQPGKVHQIIIEATDQGVPPLLSTNQAIVTVNIMDTGNNPPEVRINLVNFGTGKVKNISEQAVKETFVAHVEVKDDDTGENGNVTCRIKENPLFAIEPMSRIGFKVVVNGNLDREKQDMHNVEVICNDFGRPVLSASASFIVRVTDENDNAPVFTHENYYEDMYENNNRGDVVLSVSANDEDLGNNSVIEYYVDKTVDNVFTIGPSTGIIKALDRFDHERETSYTFKVYAKDKGSPSLTGSSTVTIRINDLNDNAPKFDKSVFYFSVSERRPNGTLVNRLTATDADSGQNAEFSFVISNTPEPNLPFELFPDGVIKTKGVLDREVKSQYRFSVIAIDKGTPRQTSSSNVVIQVDDVNDHSPKIWFPKPTNDTVTLDHLKPSGTYITQVEATDADVGDNGKLSYVIEEGNGDRLFLLNLNTGVLTMAQVHEVENESDEEYRLVIAVHDSGVPQRRMDQNRMKGQDIQINKLPNNMTEVRDNNLNGTIMSRHYDKMDTLRKKKEVSFSFEDDLDGLRDHEISFSNNSVFMENGNEVGHCGDRQTGGQLKTFHLHHSPAGFQAPTQGKLWVNPPTGQKSIEGKSSREDNNSDTSRETVTSDSGRGASDEEFPLAHNTSREDPNISGSGGNSHLLKCSMPPRHNHSSSVPLKMGQKQTYPLPPALFQNGRQHGRPNSTDLTDRIPNNKENVDRSLSNLVGNEKPKFTVRKPYTDREIRDKKSESWVPSYV